MAPLERVRLRLMDSNEVRRKTLFMCMRVISPDGVPRLGVARRPYIFRVSSGPPLVVSFDDKGDFDNAFYETIVFWAGQVQREYRLVRDVVGGARSADCLGHACLRGDDVVVFSHPQNRGSQLGGDFVAQEGASSVNLSETRDILARFHGRLRLYKGGLQQVRRDVNLKESFRCG